jgi:hypothetical protein
VNENCHGNSSPIETATENASHEIAEAVTNPHVFSDLGLTGFDGAHLGWQLFDATATTLGDDEIGDACERYDDAHFVGPADLPYSLQRLWSNQSAAAGHSPCVPESTEPYFNLAPLALETLSVTPGGAMAPQMALGYEIPVGQSKPISVAYYSDARTGYWDVSAVEGNGIAASSTPQLTIAVGKGVGLNGDKDNVTVTVNAAGASGNAVLLTLVSTAPGHTTHYAPILIGAY